MKSATLPSLRVKPELRAEIESLLTEEETLSEFVQSAVLESVRHRRDQAEFIRRGMASLATAKQSDRYVEADAAMGRLERKLAMARKSAVGGPQGKK